MDSSLAVSNLGVFTNYNVNTLEEDYQVDAVYTDFSKAFYWVDHKLLLN